MSRAAACARHPRRAGAARSTRQPSSSNPAAGLVWRCAAITRSRALAGDPQVMAKSGQLLTVGELAREYGFTDVDGTQPEPFQISEHKPEEHGPSDAS